MLASTGVAGAASALEVVGRALRAHLSLF